MSEIDPQVKAEAALDVLQLIKESIQILRPQTVGEVMAILNGMELAAKDVMKNGPA